MIYGVTERAVQHKNKFIWVHCYKNMGEERFKEDLSMPSRHVGEVFDSLDDSYALN